MRVDRRLVSIGLTVIAVVVIGGVLTLLPDRQPLPFDGSDKSADIETKEVAIDPGSDPKGHERQARENELRLRFQQAVAMLHAKQYDYAVKTLHRVLELAPRLPEAHVNMGYALIGLEQYKAAVDFFDTATNLKPMQLNAYYGLALAYEGDKNYQMAISAMESYIHLAADDDPFMRKARAASWEWSEHLKIARSGEAPPRIIGRDIETKELVEKAFGEEDTNGKKNSGDAAD